MEGGGGQILQHFYVRTRQLSRGGFRLWGTGFSPLPRYISLRSPPPPGCRTYVGHCSHIMCIRFSPDNHYVMSMGGDDRSAMQWRVLPVAHDDVVVDRPEFAEYRVYQPPKKAAVVMEVR